MQPVDFPESNFVFKGDGDRVIDLHVLKTPLGSYSCWQLSPEDMTTLLLTGKIWLGIVGSNHPPVLLTVNQPPEVEMERHIRALDPDLRLRIDTAS